jgi:hypothetical protein
MQKKIFFEVNKALTAKFQCYKTFSPLPVFRENKLECLSLADITNLVYYFWLRRTLLKVMVTFQVLHSMVARFLKIALQGQTP